MFQFNDLEISLFNNSYFSYVNNTIEIQSKNTGHWWLIQKVEMPIKNKIRVWHKYHVSHRYHVQCHVDTCVSTHAKITTHDIIVLNRTPKRIKKLRSKYKELYCS